MDNIVRDFSLTASYVQGNNEGSVAYILSDKKIYAYISPKNV